MRLAVRVLLGAALLTAASGFAVAQEVDVSLEVPTVISVFDLTAEGSSDWKVWSEVETEPDPDPGYDIGIPSAEKSDGSGINDLRHSNAEHGSFESLVAVTWRDADSRAETADPIYPTTSNSTESAGGESFFTADLAAGSGVLKAVIGGWNGDVTLTVSLDGGLEEEIVFSPSDGWSVNNWRIATVEYSAPEETRMTFRVQGPDRGNAFISAAALSAE
jgi:hypothetical protein